MTEQQLDDLIARVTAGAGVEAALHKMGLNSDVETDFLKKHPNARTRLKESKQQGQLLREELANGKADIAPSSPG
jgi:hypothetical protein